MHTHRAIVIAAGILGATTVIAPALLADSILIARDTSTPAIREVTGVSTATSQARQVRAVANIARGVTVFDATGSFITLQRKGAKPIIQGIDRGTPVRFTNLTAGVPYRVIVDGIRVATVTPVHAVSPATNLHVNSTSTPGAVRLTWDHAPRGTEGDITFIASATSQTAPTIELEVIGATSTTVSGLRGNALYTFTITPLNSTGPGKPTRAIMSRTLDDFTGKQPSAQPEPQRTPQPEPAPAPPPAPGPAPAPQPSTKTIDVCPEGFTEAGSLCQRTAPYTFDVKPYTFHREFVQTGSTEDFVPFQAGSGPACPNAGTYHRDGARGEGCYRYDPVGYWRDAKDPTPAGYTDTGSDWRKRESAPAGFTDDGTQWVQFAAKETKVVSA